MEKGFIPNCSHIDAKASQFFLTSGMFEAKDIKFFNSTFSIISLIINFSQ